MDTQKEMAITIAMSALTFSSLCNLLIEKGVISKEEKQQIIKSASDEIKRTLEK